MKSISWLLMGLMLSVSAVMHSCISLAAETQCYAPPKITEVPVDKPIEKPVKPAKGIDPLLYLTLLLPAF